MNLCDFLEQSTAAFEGVAGIASVLTCAFLAACVSVLLGAILSRSYASCDIKWGFHASTRRAPDYEGMKGF